MIRYLTAICITTAAAVVLALGGTAQAGASCSKATVAATGWSIQTNQVSVGFDLKCGGSIPTNYRVTFHLQREDNNFIFHNDLCGSTACTTYRPTPCCGTYAAGSEHGSYPSTDFNWTDTSGSIHGDTFRIQAIVNFNNGDQANIYSLHFSP